jgi:hypothetical protein
MLIQMLCMSIRFACIRGFYYFVDACEILWAYFPFLILYCIGRINPFSIGRGILQLVSEHKLQHWACRVCYNKKRDATMF